MAYISQGTKQEIEAVVQSILKKYGLKGWLSIRGNSTLVLTIASGKIDFIENFNRNGLKSNMFCFSSKGFIQVNTYHYMSQFDGEARQCIEELVKAMNNNNYNESRIDIDYFDADWYIEIYIGNCTKQSYHAYIKE